MSRGPQRSTPSGNDDHHKPPTILLVDDEDGFNAWYDEEHVPLRLAVPGFLNARRYKAAEANWPRYLALYDLESVDVLKTSQYARLAQERSDVAECDLPGVSKRGHAAISFVSVSASRNERPVWRR